MASLGNVLEGAGGGALAGGALGPIGAIGGGLLGGLGGLFGGDGEDPRSKALRDQMAQLYGQIGGRDPYQLGPMAQAGESPWAGRGSSLADMLFAQARGEGPSVAMEQARQMGDRAAGTQGSLAAGAVGRGVSPGAAFLQAANNAGAAHAAAGQTGVLGALGERLGAMGQLGGLIGTMNGQANQLGEFNAGQTNTGALANLQGMINQRQMTDQERMQLLLQQLQALQSGKQPTVGDILLSGGGAVAGMGLGAYGSNNKPQQ